MYLLDFQRVGRLIRAVAGSGGATAWRGAVIPALLLAVLSTRATASDHVLFRYGVNAPAGDMSTFADPGSAFEVRWRHYNRNRSAYEFSFGYSQNGLQGEVQNTIDGYEALIRQKNLLAQQQGGDGLGTMLAEFGTFEMFYIDANVMYRFLKQSRFSPIVSFGGGIYNWRLPFRIKFFDVPSFGEQNSWEPIGHPNGQTFYAFVFPEQAIDYTKHETDGGLNFALGADWRLSRSWALEVEARAHIVFSSPDGNPEVGSDDQDYLEDLTFLVANGAISYRF
jgi:hypothetical protein